MSSKNKEYLKGRFANGCVPDETDFEDLLDSGVNKQDDVDATIPATVQAGHVPSSGAVKEYVGRVAPTKDELTQLSTKVGELVGGNVILPFNLNDGHFVSKYGAYTESSAFAMTQPISVSNGDKIVAECAGYNTNVSIFALYNDGSDTYTSKVVCTDSTKRQYTFIATSNCKIVVSYEKTFGLSLAKVVDGTIQGIQDELESKADASDVHPLVTKLEQLVGKSLAVSFTSTDGHFISKYGVYSDSNGFSVTNPISVVGGEKITAICAGYLTNIAIFSIYNSTQGTYSSEVVCDGYTKKTYEFTPSNDCQIVISFKTSEGLMLTKQQNGEIQNIENRIESSINIMSFAGIPVVGIIGDSLSCGVTAKQDSTMTNNPTLAWWNVLKRDSGAEYKLFAKGGLHTRSWITDSEGLTKALTSGNECCSYIIGLGVNDEYSLGVSYLGTASDINDTNCDLNADSYYGNYAKIIAKIHQRVPSAKFFLLTNPREWQRNVSSFNSAVRTIASRYDYCYLVDLATEKNDFYNKGFIASQCFGGDHYSALAYQCMGKVLEEELSKVIVSNSADFRYIQFALDSINNS